MPTGETGENFNLFSNLKKNKWPVDVLPLTTIVACGRERSGQLVQVQQAAIAAFYPAGIV